MLPATLRTSRLILREPRPADAAIIFDSYAQDRLVTKYLVWKPHTKLADVEAFIAECIHARTNGVRYPYVLAMQETEDLPIGMLEYKRIARHQLNLGYVLARKYWGQGLMPEAVRKLADEALAIPSIFRLQATCDVDNGPSARTLEKAGFVREGLLARHTLHPNVSPEPRSCYLYARHK